MAGTSFLMACSTVVGETGVHKKCIVFTYYVFHNRMCIVCNRVVLSVCDYTRLTLPLFDVEVTFSAELVLK